MRQYLPLLGTLPFVLYIAVFIATYATLASRLHQLAPPDMSRFRCALLIGGSISSPIPDGLPREFRQHVASYRLILFATGFLLLPVMAGAMTIIGRIP